MKVIIDFFRCFFTDAVHFLQILNPRLGNLFYRPKIIKQVMLAAAADSLHFVKARFKDGFCPLLPMGTDGKPVSFVTQILQIKSYRRLKRQSETFFVFHMVKLFSGITFRPLGYGDNSNAVKVKVFQAFMHRIQLPAPTVEPDSTENSISNQLLLLDVGSGKEQIVYIENYSSLSAEVGKEYKMFADVAGIRDGYPYLIARYVYEVQ